MSTVQNSTAVRNAMLDAWEAAMGPGVRIRMYTGALPANCVAAETGTLLAEWVLASDYAPDAANGVKTLSSTPIQVVALNDGTVAHYRIYNAAGTVCHEQGSVTATGGGGDTTIDSTLVTNGQKVNLTGWSRTAAGA